MRNSKVLQDPVNHNRWKGWYSKDGRACAFRLRLSMAYGNTHAQGFCRNDLVSRLFWCV